MSTTTPALYSWYSDFIITLNLFASVSLSYVFYIVGFFYVSEFSAEIFSDTFSVGFSLRHIEAPHGILFPFLFVLIDFQALKQFIPSAEIAVESVDEHRLSEKSWTAEVIVHHAMSQFPDNLGLIHIYAAILAYFLESSQAFWQFPAVVESVVHGKSSRNVCESKDNQLIAELQEWGKLIFGFA